MADQDDEPPFADPSIRLEYESFLGSFMVQFNAIEVILSDIIHLALTKAARPDIVESMPDHTYVGKVFTLSMLQLSMPAAGSTELVKELRRLGAERNRLAHGHFDQNPFDGSFSILSQRRRHGRRIADEMPVEQLIALLNDARKTFQDLRGIEARFEFDILDED